MIINFYLMSSNPKFQLPENQVLPVIMIGTGTGIAPFRGFWQERKNCFLKNPNNKYGQLILYYGCRHSEKDYLYKEEISELTKKNILSSVYVAFSRDGKTKKVMIIK
jgi:sulfite reductase alpha subunit-like flavoprotein